MEGNNYRLYKILNKIRIRMYLNTLINIILLGIALGLGITLIISVIARLYPVYNPYILGGYATVAAVLILVIISMFKFPKYRQAALKADSLGLSERVITAVELDKDTRAIALIQKMDALKHLMTLDYKSQIKIYPRRRNVLMTIGISFAVGINMMIPNGMADLARHKHEFNITKKTEIKKLENIKKETEKNSKLTSAQKDEIKKKLEELKKDINLAKKDTELNKAVEKLEKKLDLSKEKNSEENLEKIESALSKSELSKGLSEAIKNKNQNALKKAMNDLEKNLKKADTSKAKDLAQKLSALTNELKGNTDLQEAVDGLSKKISNGDIGNISSELSNLSNKIQSLEQDEDFNETLSAIQQQMSSSENNAGQQEANNGDGAGNGQSGSGTGNGQGQGQGQGQGSGAGGGAGNGTGMQEGSVAGESSGGLSKKGSSERKEGEYEKIFAPSSIGGDSEKSQLTGKKDNSGNTEQVTTDKGINVRGQSVPYNQVIGEYKQKAFESTSKNDIPAGMEDIVKNYFSSLEE